MGKALHKPYVHVEHEISSTPYTNLLQSAHG